MRCVHATLTEMYFPQVTAELIRATDTQHSSPLSAEKEDRHKRCCASFFFFFFFALLASKCVYILKLFWQCRYSSSAPSVSALPCARECVCASLRRVITCCKIAFYYPGGWTWWIGTGGENISDVTFIRAIFLPCSPSLCQVSDWSIVEHGDDFLLSSVTASGKTGAACHLFLLFF